MVKINLTPTPHKVFNEFDRFGELLDLQRLEGEGNVEYKRRLFDVMVRRADSTYIGLIFGITRELGLKILDVMNIKPVLDLNGDTVAIQPAIIFIDTKCYIYNDYNNKTINKIIDRFDSSGNGSTLSDLRDRINETGIFTAVLLADAETQHRSMTIFNQESIVEVTSFDISDAGIKIILPNTNLIIDTVSIRSENITRRVSSEIEIIKSGDYYINHQDGIIITASAPAPGSIIRYTYRDDDFLVSASPVIIHNLQSKDFKSKMFEQITNKNNETYSGLPTNIGADIINELLSVYPSMWGK